MKDKSSSGNLKDVGVLALVPDLWESPWMARHQVLSRLAKYFNVVWVEPAVGWRERLHRDTDDCGVKYGRSAATFDLALLRTGKFLPKLHRPALLASLTASLRLRIARNMLLKRGVQKLILYLWRSEFDYALDLIDYDICCYHIDDEYTFSNVEKPISDRESAIIKRADLVIIPSKALLEKKGHLNPCTICVPNGVDFGAFSTPHVEPEDLKSIRRPRIGYVGLVKTHLDLALVTELARLHSEWSFVFVGPNGYLGKDAPYVEMLSQMANVHFLGPKGVDALPGYTQHMDVCMLCYKVNDYTRFIYPLKLHEYLASGRPVVGSPIRSLQEFSDVIELASDVMKWSQALARLLESRENCQERVETRRSLASEHDWSDLVHTIGESFCERLGTEYLARWRTLETELKPRSVDKMA